MKPLIGRCIRYENGKLELLDQQLLPDQEIWIEITQVAEMVEAIYQLKVRGAPAIGVAAALMIAKYAEGGATADQIVAAAQQLNQARPTAVNLMVAMDRLVLTQPQERLTPAFLSAEAEKIFEEDVALCRQLGENGAALIQDGDRILHHCNTGGLATAGIGTALGVIQTAHEQGKNIHVYIDETRPLLQGGRLTAWECGKLGIPHTIICDNMAAVLMRDGKINKVFLGSDRVAANGDFANKIGTYNVAVLAQYHGVAFYPVAPYTTIDRHCPNGAAIPIEERKPEEVRGVFGSFGSVRWAPATSGVYNPAFDVTPAALITKFVFNHGVFGPDELKAGKHLHW